MPRRTLSILLLLAALAAPARADEPRVSDGLKPFVDRGVLAGAVVLVASPEKVLALESVGYSDAAAKVPMKVDDLFWIASMNKPITATALMILVDEGKVKLDDPVEKYLPEFPFCRPAVPGFVRIAGRGRWVRSGVPTGEVVGLVWPAVPGRWVRLAGSPPRTGAGSLLGSSGRSRGVPRGPWVRSGARGGSGG